MPKTAKYSDKKILKKDGSEIYVNIEASPIIDNEGNHVGTIGFFYDITERKRIEDELKYQANHDMLTSIYNRFFFEEQMKLISKERNLSAGIIVIDVDGLKYINDTLGHHQGDRLLIELTSLLISTFRPADIIARIGGDEFAILIRQIDVETTKVMVERLKENVTDYNKNLKRHQNPISISIGYAVKDYETKTLEQTFKQADEMLFREKIPKRDDVRASILNVLKATMLEKDHRTEEHMTRLKEIAIRFGELVGLDQNEMKKLILTTELHDIGKVIIPDHILNKSKALTQKEFDIVKKHTEAGYRIAKATPEISDIANYILFSHERWDGQGYPNGLAGKKIPLISRMVFIIDSYDAMTNIRPYREAMSLEATTFELDKNAGAQFDPFLVKIFIKKVLPVIKIIQPES
jgi:diguanylate cyclase (GGDEF)-like protein